MPRYSYRRPVIQTPNIPPSTPAGNRPAILAEAGTTRLHGNYQVRTSRSGGGDLMGSISESSNGTRIPTDGLARSLTQLYARDAQGTVIGHGNQYGAIYIRVPHGDQQVGTVTSYRPGMSEIIVQKHPSGGPIGRISTQSANGAGSTQLFATFALLAFREQLTAD